MTAAVAAPTTPESAVAVLTAYLAETSRTLNEMRDYWVKGLGREPLELRQAQQRMLETGAAIGLNKGGIKMMRLRESAAGESAARTAPAAASQSSSSEQHPAPGPASADEGGARPRALHLPFDDEHGVHWISVHEDRNLRLPVIG